MNTDFPRPSQYTHIDELVLQQQRQWCPTWSRQAIASACGTARWPPPGRYGGNIAHNSYEPGFELTLGLKDVNLALEAAKAKQALLPAAEIVRETMLEAVEQGLGSKDWSALAKVTRRRAGLKEAEA